MFVSFWLIAVSLVAMRVRAQCTDVHVVFARGSGEMQGFGICGTPLVSGITSALQGMTVSSYAVRYMADVAQTSAGPGATDMTSHVVQVAQQCPSTVFVLGGYSQGASVTDIAIGIRTPLGSGQTIPTELAPRIKAVVTFGNPLKLTGGTIASQSQLYGPKAIEICNTGDPVCAGGFNFMAHTTYPSDGGVAKAAQQAAQLVRAGGTTGGSTGQSQGEGRASTTNQGSSTTGTGTGGGLSGLGGLGQMPGLGGAGASLPSFGQGLGQMPSLGGGGGSLPSFGQGLGSSGLGGLGGGGMPSFGFGNLLRGGQ